MLFLPFSTEFTSSAELLLMFIEGGGILVQLGSVDEFYLILLGMMFKLF